MRGTLAAAVACFSACDRLTNSETIGGILKSAESLNRTVSRTLFRQRLAREYPASAISAHFRANGTTEPDSETYRRMADNQFVDYQLEIGGLVENPLRLSLAELRAAPSRTQITRHDCVEGWSAIGKWRGAKLAALLETVGVKPEARYVVFHCADPMEADGTGLYYESIDMDDASHAQTILAYDLNDRTLPIKNGAPIRLRVERQLGYKHAKYVMRIELVESFAKIEGGKGGYWEDQGYEWYAGI